MKELDRLATTGKMIDQSMAQQAMPMAPQGMAPQAMPMAPQAMPMAPQGQGMKKGGVVKAKAKSSSASKRADGCAIRGKTRA
jgi:hypothetical protein